MTAEERYDIECQINALYDEAEYAEDHNNYWKANSLRQEANELQKKLDADTGDTNECLSENCDPFDVDWSNKKYVERRKQSKGIKEGRTRNLKESSARVGYIVGSFGGEGDHEFHYVGYDYNEARTLWQDERDDWVSLGLSGGDTYLIFAQYINNDPTAFDSLYQEWMADPDSVDTDDYDILDEYSWEIIDKVLDEDYTGNPEERTDHLDYVDDNPTDDKFKFPKNITKKEDDHCEKVNPVINHDPDDKDVLNEDWRDDVGLAPMWCCKNCKDLYEYMKEHADADAKDKTFAKLAREAVKQVRQKYSVSNQEAVEIIARGQALYKHLYESENVELDKSLKEAHQPPVISGFVVDFCDGDFNWNEDFGESYAYIDVYPQKPGIGTDTTVTFIFSGPHGDWYDYDFSARDYGYQFGQHVVDLEVSYFTPEYKNDELIRKVAKYSDYPENNIISDSDAMAILGVDQATYDQLIVKAAEEAAKWFNDKAEDYVDDHASDLFNWDRW